MIKDAFRQFLFLGGDIRRWKVSSFKDLFYVVFELGVWGCIFYRMGRFLFLINIPIVKIVLRFIAFLFYKFSEIFFGLSIKPGTEIGPGLYVGHTGAVIIHPEARIGKNLSIGTGVIIGERGVGHGGVPTIGDNVYLGVGAKVLGNIKIGNNVRVGANSVVLGNVLDGATVVGVPAKIVLMRER